MNYITDLRTQLGLSQQVFADLLLVSRTLLSMAEINKRQLPLRSTQRLTMLAEFLKNSAPISPTEDPHKTIDPATLEIYAAKARICRYKAAQLKDELESKDKKREMALDFLRRFPDGQPPPAADRFVIEIDSTLGLAYKIAQLTLYNHLPEDRREIEMKMFLFEKEAEKWREWAEA